MRPKEHHATIAAARADAESRLRAWELDMDLRYGPRALRFVYERAEVIDRAPTPGAYTLTVEPIVLITSIGDVRVRVGFPAFPAPLASIARDAVVDTMYDRYARYRDGGPTLADTANYCLTALWSGAGGGRAEASKRYAISEKVLTTMSNLAANKGGAEARKAPASAHAYSPTERQWLEEAMRLLIRRAAEVAFDAQAPRSTITMADLPAIDGP